MTDFYLSMSLLFDKPQTCQAATKFNQHTSLLGTASVKLTHPYVLRAGSRSPTDRNTPHHNQHRTPADPRQSTKV